MKKYYGIHQNSNGDFESWIYTGPLAYESYIKATFSPCSVACDFIPLTICGKTYAERKADARDKIFRIVQGFSIAQDLAYSDFVILGDFFERCAKYGMKEELQENGLI